MRFRNELSSLAEVSLYFGRAWTPVYSFPSFNKLVDSHSLPFYFFNVNFNITLPPNPELSKLSLYDRNDSTLLIIYHINFNPSVSLYLVTYNKGT